jgi:integral membrane protein 2B
MELNRTRILPPKTLFDMIGKINNGYYDVDTEIVRDSYRVVTPALDKTDEEDFGVYINRECVNFPMYRLERITSPVFKRSIPSNEVGLFREFAGRKIAEFHIMNLESIPGNKK